MNRQGFFIESIHKVYISKYKSLESKKLIVFCKTSSLYVSSFFIFFNVHSHITRHLTPWSFNCVLTS